MASQTASLIQVKGFNFIMRAMLQNMLREGRNGTNGI